MFMIIGSLLSSCVGEQGEPGPVGEQGEQGEQGPVGEQGEQGEQGDKGDAGNDGSDGKNGIGGGIGGVVKSGFFEGTISGTRKDGVAFSYDFKFDRRRVDEIGASYGLVPTDVEGFIYNQTCDCHYLMLVRQDSAFGGNMPSELRVVIQMKNKGTANEEVQIGDDGGYEGFGQIFFVKELSATSLFRVEAMGYESGLAVQDAKEITNYQHDSNTGHMTFEFDITVNGEKGKGYPLFNSTEHDLNIKGKFDSGEGKVYKDVVARTGN